MWLYKLICVCILATATVNACPFCYHASRYNGGCRCSAWRPGPCCEGCSNPGIAHCKPGQFQCGDFPDGIQCTDCYLPYKPAGFNQGCVRKPCSENNGGCSHLCTRVGGFTKCTCRAGYQLSSDEYSCIDIDECLMRTSRCGQQCVNTIGSFKCTCNSGYRLNPERFTCDDIDDCRAGVSKCSQICINSNGTYHCECEEGFYLDNDNITCKNERYYESHMTSWQNVTCNLGEPQLRYNNTLFEVHETLSNSDDVWIGYIYVKVPFLLLGCASLQSENGVNVKDIADCLTICRDGLFAIKRTSHGHSVLRCICVTGSFDTTEKSCKGGAQSSLCNNCSEIYTRINVNASNVDGPDDNPEGDCLMYYYPHFKWHNCSNTDGIRSMCSNANYTDVTATATTTNTAPNAWSAGNKLCLTNGQYPSFERSITNTGFTAAQTQYYWTGMFRANILIKHSLKDYFSRVSTDSYVYVKRNSKLLYIANKHDMKRALCVTGTESTSRPTGTSKYTTEVTASKSPSTYSETSVFLTKVTSHGVTTTGGSKSTLPTAQMSKTRHLETTEYVTEVTPLITQSKYSETSVFFSKVTTSHVSPTYGSTRSLSTTQMYTTLATGNALSASNDRIIENSRHPNSKKSPAVGVGVGVSVGLLLLVGGAVFIVLLKRRGKLQCNRKTGNNKHSENETVFKENMTYGKSNEDNVANHNYFILEKCGQSFSNNAEHYNYSNEANMEDGSNTIHEPGESYEHVKVENCDYDHTNHVLTSGSDARKTDHVYNKLKIDRPGDDDHEQRHGLVQCLEEDYDTTSTVVTHGKDEVSEYNHIPHTAYKADLTADDMKSDKGGEYEAINVMKFKVTQPDDYVYAHVNKDRMK